jgi:simple sugar transport system ATP-binding protein
MSFEVRTGEILGVAGVQGNGQTELVEAIAGLRALTSGRVQLGGKDITQLSVAARHGRGLAHVPEDRHTRGLILDFTVTENILLGEQRRFAGPLSIDRGALSAHTDRLIEDYDIRPTDPGALGRALSGGNQQKVVVARELSRVRPRMLLCAQPTRGVDVGAIELIHRRLIAARDAGLGILLVSAELSELQALADRIIVMYEGRIAGELDAEALGREGAFERIGHLMTGGEATS